MIQKQVAQTRFEDFLNRYIRTRAGQNVQRIQRNSRKKVLGAIRTALDSGFEEELMLQEIAKRIQTNVRSVYRDFGRKRAVTIARTEIAIGSSIASREAAKSLGITEMQKEWVSRIDHRSRGMSDTDSTNHISMNGVRVGLNDKFEVPYEFGIDMMDGPGDPEAPPRQIVNCRCVQAYALPGKSLNLANNAARSRYWREQQLKRARLERRFASNLRGYFRNQGQLIVDELENVADFRVVDGALESIFETTQTDLESIFRSNYERVLRSFGQEVLNMIET